MMDACVEAPVRRLVPTALVLLMALACDDTAEQTWQVPDDPTPDTPIDLGWSITVEVDATATVAGEPVAYTVTVTDPSGATVDDVGISVHSDLEPEMRWNRLAVEPRLAGSHTLTFIVTTDGGEVAFDRPLEVSAGPAWDLDLSLSDLAFQAGGSIDYTLTAVDRYGNDVDASAVSISVDSPDVSLDTAAAQLTGTVPGTYLVTAALDGMEDPEPFVVVPGDAEALTLALSTTQLEVGQTTHATVLVVDAYGNPTDDVWTLTATGGDNHVSFANVTVLGEGWFTVTASVDGTDLTDSIGPFLVDSSGPDLVIQYPDRGTWMTTTAVPVTGYALDAWSTATVTIDGVTVPTFQGGFSQTFPHPKGLFIVETTATDADGNTTRDYRSVMTGPSEDYGKWEHDAITVRIGDGPNGLGVLSTLADDLIAGIDLNSMIPSPVFHDESESCVLGLCVTWYSATVYAYNARFQDVDFVIDARSDGTILTRVTVHDPAIDWSASGVAVEIPYSTHGNVHASAIVVEIVFKPVLQNGVIQMIFQSTNAYTVGFDFQWDSFLEDVIEFFGVDLDAMVEEPLIDAIYTAVDDEVPPLLAGALQDLELNFSFDLLGAPLYIEAMPHTLTVDANGLTLKLDTLVETSVFQGDHGRLLANWAEPGWPSDTGVGIGVSGDFLNQLFHVVWGTGLLDMTVPSEELGIDGESLSLFFPGLTQPEISVHAPLPPIVWPSSNGAELFEVRVGDLEVRLADEITGAAALQAYVSAVVGLDVDASPTLLSAGFGDVDLGFNVTVPDPRTPAAANMEILLEELLPMLLPSLTGALSEVELPSIEGFGLTNLTVSAGGPDKGWIVVDSDLAVAP